jgi:ribosome biogenesis GTP-binding protein YsxC/EngB
MSLLHQARFFITVNHLRDLPATAVPEVAFAGRSNAGKSTAINILCNQKRLAFSSKTPGRTQHINYFSVMPAKAEDPLGFLVDLPGYGYAEAPGETKSHWVHLLGDYVQARQQLAGLVIMMDVVASKRRSELSQAGCACPKPWNRRRKANRQKKPRRQKRNGGNDPIEPSMGTRVREEPRGTLHQRRGRIVRA